MEQSEITALSALYFLQSLKFYSLAVDWFHGEVILSALITTKAMRILRFLLLSVLSGIFLSFQTSEIGGQERLFDQFHLRSAWLSTSAEESGVFDKRDSFDRPMFGQDVEFHLGQRRKRSGSSGRVWTNLYLASAVLHPKTETEKIRPDILGFQVGFDVVRSQLAYLSLFYNFNRSQQNLHSVLSSDIDNHFFGGGYFLYLSGCHFGFVGGLGYDQYSVRNDFGGGKGSGLQTNLFSEFGIDFSVGKWAIKPFAALQHEFLYHGRIGESPNIVQGDWNIHGLDALIGLRVNWKPLENLEIQMRSTWVHQVLDRSPPFYVARFSAVHGTGTPIIFHYQGDTGRDWAWLGLGMKFEFYYNAFLFLDYDVMVNKRLTSHLGNIGLCLGW